jgi:hypothetical protein
MSMCDVASWHQHALEDFLSGMLRILRIAAVGLRQAALLASHQKVLGLQDADRLQVEQVSLPITAPAIPERPAVSSSDSSEGFAPRARSQPDRWSAATLLHAGTRCI